MLPNNRIMRKKSKQNFFHFNQEISFAQNRLFLLIVAVLILLGLAISFFLLRPAKKAIIVKKEIVSRRDGKSYTYKNSDGTYTKKIYLDNVNYKDADDNWQKINTNWQKEGNYFSITKASYNATIPIQASGWVSFELKGHKVSFRLGDTLNFVKDVPAKDTASAEVTGDKAIYKNVYKNTNLERIATTTGIKQDFILKAKGHPTSFSENIKTDLKLKLENGDLSYYDGSKLIIVSKAPVVSDASGMLIGAKYILQKNVLVTKLPKLTKVVYPIRVDPSITSVHNLNKSGVLYKFGSAWPPTAISSLSSLLYVGTWLQSGSSYGIYRSYVSYDTKSIPDTAHIIKANLTFYPWWSTSAKTPNFDIKIGYGLNTSNYSTWGPTLTTADWGSGTNLSTLATTSSTWGSNSVKKPVSLASVNKAGNTEYEISSSLETGAAPTNFRILMINHLGSPHLEVTYSTGINAPTINSLDADSDNELVASFNDNSNEEDDFHFYVSTVPVATSESSQRYISDASEKAGIGLRSQKIVAANTNSKGLYPNTRYYLRLRGHEHAADFYSQYSNELSATTFASAPENFTAITGWDAINGYNNALTWRDPDPEHQALKYHVYYFTPGASSWTQIGGESITGTSYTHTNLQPGKTYYYRVFSVNSVGEENPAYASTSILSSGGVINLIANDDWSASEGYHVHLGWQDNDMLNSSPKYRIYVSSNPLDGSGWSSWSQLAEVTTPYYKHLAVNPNTEYAYRIYGLNSLNEESAEFAYTSLTITPVSGGGGSAVTLQYGLNGYSATQDTHIYKNYPTLTSGSQSRVELRAFDGAARGLIKFDMSGKIPSGATITGATLSLYYYSFGVANPGSPLLNVYKLTSTNSWQESTANWNNIGNGGSWATSNPAGAATNLPSWGSWPPEALWTTFDVTQITQDALNNNNNLFNIIVKLNNEGSSVYPIYFRSKEGGSWPYAPFPVSPKLTINYLSATTPPDAPTLSSLVADSSTQISANITDQSTNEDDFHIFMGSGPAPTVDIAQVNSVSTNGTGKTYSKYFSALTPNKKYYFRLKTHNHSNNKFSNYSNELSKFTLANIPQSLRGQKISGDKVQLNWDTNGNPAGTIYELYYKKDDTIVYTGTNTTFTHTTTERVNTYKVRAKNGDNVATDWTEYREVNIKSPHADYTQNPEQCAICHSSHTATLDKLLKAEPGSSYQADFCYTCHDGSGSIYNVKEAVDSNVSHHPIQDAANPSGVITCTNCHDPHGVKKPDGSYYAKLLKSKDKNGNKFFEGNEFCGACHGSGSNLIGGDHLSIFSTIPHNTKTPNPPSGTKIKCLNCHGNNNSNGSEGGAPHGSDNSRITKLAEEKVCFQCHDNAANSEDNINIKELFTYPLSGFLDNDSWMSSRHNIDSAEQSTTSKIECTKCHNPHKNSRGDKKIANPDNTYTLFNLKRPDPKLWDYNTNKGFAIFMPFYRQRAQDVDYSYGTSSYEGAQTPADGQDTFINSALPNTVMDTTSTKSSTYPDGIDLREGGYIDGKAWFSILAVGKRTGGNLRSLLRFTDIAKIPAGASITKAYFAFPTDASTPLDASKPPISIYRVTMPWQESATWNKAPIYDPAAIVASSRGSIVTYKGVKYLSWDVTSLVQGWVNLSFNNYGLMLMSPEAEGQTNDYYATFTSSENTAYTVLGGRKTMKPSLIIEYNTANPPLVQDINSFCLACHDGNPPAGVIMPNISKTRVSGVQHNTLNISNFARTDSLGDVHGGQPSVMGDGTYGFVEGTMIGSYRYGMGAIQCTDCHDPHGQNNVFHFQKNINYIVGHSVKDSTPQSSGQTYYPYQKLCQSCHSFTHVAGYNCFNCHFHGAKADSSPVSNF